MFLGDKQELSSLARLFNRSFDLLQKSLFALCATEKDFANFLAYIQRFLLHFADGGLSRLSSSRSFSRAYAQKFRAFFQAISICYKGRFSRASHPGKKTPRFLPVGCPPELLHQLGKFALASCN